MNCKICNKIHEWTREEIIRERSQTGERLKKAIEGLSPQFLKKRPEPKAWSIHEIVVHLKDTEMVYGMRYKSILSEVKPGLITYDQNLWAKNLEYKKQDFNHALSLLNLTRSENLHLLSSMNEKDFQKSGKHPEYGELSIRELFLHNLSHDISHLSQIQKVRKKIES